jgi:PAS domain S-box-containing protein
LTETRAALITREERMNAEAELLENKERFAIALGNSPTSVFDQDLDLRYTWIYNPKLGYAAHAVIGKTDAELMDANCAPALEALKRQVIATGAPAREEVAVAAPGAPMEYFDLHVEPRRDSSGRVVGVICAATDITARRKAEEALRDSEARYRSAMAIGRMASWETDYATGVRKWTPEGAALFGLDLVEGMGTVGGDKDEFLSALHPEDRHLYQAYRDIEGRQDAFAAEYRIVLPDGRTRSMSGYARVVERSADGRPLRLVNVATDVTERKAMEDRTQFLLRELSHRSRNTLAVIQAIVMMSSRNAGSVKEFSNTIANRLAALAASNDLLTDGSWTGALLGQLVDRQIGAFIEMPNPRVRVGGAEVALAADAVQAIGLALHELTTNAVKYGALSGQEGEVRVSWRIESDPAGPILRLDWTEQGGPRVAEPERKGFGQTVITQMVEQALSATTTIEYPPTGVRWSMAAPVSKLIGAAEQSAPPTR